MATSVLNDIKLWRGANDLGGKSNQLRAVFTTDALRDTGFDNAGAHVFLPGLNGAALDHRGMIDLGAGSYEDLLFAEHGDADLPITIAIDDTAGNRAYLFQGIPSQLEMGGPVGDLYGFTVQAQGTGKIARGLTLETATTARTVTFNGTAFQLDAGPSATQFLLGTLHVLAASAGDTLDVVVESDDNEAMTSPTARLTFAQKTATGYEWLSAAGAITDDWYRIAVTIGGSDPSFTFAVAIGIGR